MIHVNELGHVLDHRCPIWATFEAFCRRREGAWRSVEAGANDWLHDYECRVRDAILADVEAWAAFLESFEAEARVAAIAARAVWAELVAAEARGYLARGRAARLKRAEQRARRLSLPVRPALVPALALDEGLLDSGPLQVVRSWVDGQRNDADRTPHVLGLFGSVGCGKTVAAIWALLRHRSSSVEYVSADRLGILRTSRYGAPAEEYQRLLAARLLVVDELGVERDRDATRHALRDVVDGCVGPRRTAIIIGNLTIDDLSEHLDARTRDRLREIGDTHEFAEPSLRAPASGGGR